MNRILIGHVLDCLAELPDESVHGIVTSPPYWSLRDYKTDPIIWGDGDCRHEWGDERIVKQTPQRDHDKNGNFGDTRGQENSRKGIAFEASTGQFCLHCGAWRGSLGLEPTPSLYIEHIVEICRELRRVLRSDGVFWLNIGDSYTPQSTHRTNKERTGYNQRARLLKDELKLPSYGKAKDLCLIPFHLAIALQADGWWVRSVCIWYKRNCMPESASDRPTVDYEYVFLLTKSARYFYDGDAVRQVYTEPLDRWGGDTKKTTDHLKEDSPHAYAHHERAMRPNPAGRNLRTVWDIPTKSYSEAHFATFPNELAARCIKVTPQDVCAECGAGWERLTESEYTIPETRNTNPEIDRTRYENEMPINTGYRPEKVFTKQVETIGFAPTCTCDADKAKAVILDPFAGSGTVGQAAHDLGREFILIELNPDYYEFMRSRLGMFCPEAEFRE